MYQRIVSLAAAGVLALGIAACGKSTNKPAGADAGATSTAQAGAAATTSPSPAASKLPLPDKDSCRKATDVVQLAGPRVVSFKQAVQNDPAVYIYAVRTLPDMVNHTAQAKAAVLDARVKAILEQYQTDLEGLRTKLEEARDDRAKHQAAFDDAVAKLDKSTQNLALTCAETLANDGGRAATCDKIAEVEKKLAGPLMELNAAGADPARLRIAVPNFLRAADTVGSEYSRISDQTIDASLKSAIGRALSDLKTLRHGVASAGQDGAKIKAAVTSAPRSGEEEIDRLCRS